MGGLEGPPKPPALGGAPAAPWRSSNSFGVSGVSKGPQAPNARRRPGGAVALVEFALTVPRALALAGRARDEVEAQRVEHVGALEEVAVAGARHHV
jgi:hypothetical protein